MSHYLDWQIAHFEAFPKSSICIDVANKLKATKAADPDGSKMKAKISNMFAKERYLKANPHSETEKERDQLAWTTKLHKHWETLGCL